jgi:hypothetical protein
MTGQLAGPGDGDGASPRPAGTDAARAGDDAPSQAGETGQAGQAGPPATDVAAELAEIVRTAMRQELDGILPHVLAAIKRDRAFDELNERLGKAERLLAARRERPLAVALHQLLNRLRHLDFDQAVKTSLEAELVKILTEAGFDEIGSPGEDYDPGRHDVLSGRAVDGKGTVTSVDATGLASFGDIVVRAQVQITPRISRPQAVTATPGESSTGSSI